MALSPSNLFTTEDMEDFARDYLGLTGVDADMYYEAYYNVKGEDELNQTVWEY